MGRCCSKQKVPEKRSNGGNKGGDAVVNENNAETIVALYDYISSSDSALSFNRGDRFKLLNKTNKDWWWVRKITTNEEGYVPYNHVAEELTIETELWYFDCITRHKAEDLLLDPQNGVGTFLVRVSDRERSVNYTLSVKNYDVNRGFIIKHYRILRKQETGSYYISNNLEFPSVSDLISNYLQSPTIQPRLTNPCPKPLPTNFQLEPGQRHINRNEIKLIKKVGAGQFGDVHYGKWRNKRDVAVKELRPGTMTPEAFLEEAKIMFNFRHENLVSLYAVCTNEEPIWIIQEYMRGGSLLAFLRRNVRTFALQRLIYFATQVATGMAYLESKQLVHRDLAARNVLVGEKSVVKICDFGLARVIENNESIYVRSDPTSMLPFKWTAPEAIDKGIFSTKSDIWSFGVVLMEIFTYGLAPYKGLSNTEVLKKVKTGYRMPKPEDFDIPDQIYEKMKECWNIVPERRPNFDYLLYFLSQYQIASQPAYCEA